MQLNPLLLGPWTAHMAWMEIGEVEFSLALGTVEDKGILNISFCPRLTKGDLVKHLNCATLGVYGLRMFRRTSTSIRLLLLISASLLILAIFVDQFPELLVLKENTSNDFTILKDSSAAYVLMLSSANHASVRLNLECSKSDEDKWVRRPPTFEDRKPSADDLLLLSVLRT